MYFDSKNKAECSGCTACYLSCPVHAISMKEDEEGFVYPEIQPDVCINCNLCRKVCSWEHSDYSNAEKPLTLAAVLKDKDERQRSTSGGAFYSIASWVLRQNGVVYGAAFDDRLQLKHIGVDNIVDLQKLRGSKYLQSSLENVFNEVKEKLEEGKCCYFTGTGCQIAGLKSFLRKDYPTLLTSDLVCHGVPSQKLFNEHIAYLEHKYHDKVVDYKFRDYKVGGGCEACGFANREPVIKPTYELSPYLYSFMYGYTYRSSCYNCHFARVPRQGDITIADFWGVEKYFPELDRSCGTSLLFVNTDKGRDVWEKVSDDFDYQVSNVADASRYNGNVVHASKKPDIRDDVYKLLEEKGYKYLAENVFRSPNYNKLILRMWLSKQKWLKPIINLHKGVNKK